MAGDDFEALFRLSSVPAIVTDLDDVVVEVNDAYLALSRRTREQLVGDGSHRLVHPEDQGEIAAVAFRLSPDNPTVVHERRHVRGDGSVVRIRVRMTLLLDLRRVLIQVLDWSETGEQSHPNFGLSAAAGALRMAWDDGIVLFDVEGRVLRCFVRAAEMLGHLSGHLAGRALSDPVLGIVGFDRQPLGADRDPVLTALRTEANVETTIGVPADDGGLRWLSVKVEYVLGEPNPAVAFLRDVTEGVTVADERRRLAAIAERTADLVLAWDADGALRWTNRAAREALPAGTHVTDVLAPSDRDRWATDVRAALAAAGQWSGELDLLRTDGHVLPVAVSVVADESDAGAGSMVAHDLTERIRLERELAHRASHDPLTGVANRTLLLAVLESDLDKGRPVAVAFVDLDGFKGVNDRLGHAAGDRLLVEVASRLRALAPPDALVARVGGDEFVVVLANQIEAIGFADHAAGELAGAGVGASLGVAAAEPGDRPGELLARADAAMYERKRARGDR